jgi:type VI secretion system protein ImpI
VTLRLEIAEGPSAGAARVLPEGPFRVATHPDGTGTPGWVLPSGAGDAAPAGAVLARRGGGTVLRVEEGEVALDGAPVPPGAEVPIGPGVTLAVGSHRLLTRTEGAARDAHRAPATVSAILSDVTPGGEAAEGLLPGRTGEDWLGELTGRAPRDALPDPVAAPLPTGRAVLPEDWLSEPARDGSGGEARLEQVPIHALPADVGVVRAPDAPPTDDGPALARAARDLHRAARLAEGERDAPPETQIANAGAALRLLLDAVAGMERGLHEALAELDLEPPDGPPSPAALDPGAILADRSGQTAIALAARLEAIERVQEALTGALGYHATEARLALDPASVEGEVARTGGIGGRLAPGRARWAAYRRRYAPEDRPAPLSREAITAAVARRLEGRVETPSIGPAGRRR